MLHNNRHLTQGSPDFTDSRDRKGTGRGGRDKKEKIGEKRKKTEKRGEGRIQRQVSISDRRIKSHEDLELQ